MPELEHLDRIAQVEMKDLVGIEYVHFAERARLEKVVDGGALSANASGQIHSSRRDVRLAEISALNRVRLQLQQLHQISGGHHHRS